MDSKFITFPKEEKIISTKGNEKIKIIPKIIWFYWEDQKVPYSINSFIEQIRLLNKDHEIRILNKVNIIDYLPNFHIEGEMPLANKSDLIRLELLYLYGGIWMDASIISNESLSWIHNINKNKSFDIIGYYRERTTIDYSYPIIETWFMATYPKNEFIKKWLEILQPLGKLGSVAYFKTILNRNDYSEIKQLITPPEYLLVYLACQIAQRELGKIDYYLKKAEDFAFFIQEKFEWNREKTTYLLTQTPYSQQYFKIIKLTGAERGVIDKFEKYQLINKKSLIGKLYNKTFQ